MSKEILTTANMNEIVQEIYKLTKKDNPVAQLVFQLNDCINSIVPGKPISKATKTDLSMLWDNLIVGVANDMAGVGEQIIEVLKADNVSEEDLGVMGDISALCVEYGKLRNSLNTKSGEGADETELGMMLDMLETAVRVVPVDSLAKKLECDASLLVAVIAGDTDAIKELTCDNDTQRMMTISMQCWFAIRDAKKSVENDEETCYGCGDCKCEDDEDEEFDEIAHQIYAILKEEGSRKCQCDKDIHVIKIDRKRAISPIITAAMFGFSDLL